MKRFLAETFDDAKMLQRQNDLANKIRDILLNEWDPLGVNDIPEGRDIYDPYVAEIYHLLAVKSSVDQLYTRLRFIETEEMQVAGDKNKTKNAANQLISEKPVVSFK